MILLNFPTLVFPKLQTFLEVSNRNLQNLRRAIKWKFIDFVFCIRILIVQEIQKCYKFQLISLMEHIFPHNNSFLPSRSQSKAIYVEWCSRLETNRLRSLHRNPDRLGVPKTALYKILSRYSKSLFSIGTRLIFSINFPSKSSKFA